MGCPPWVRTSRSSWGSYQCLQIKEGDGHEEDDGDSAENVVGEVEEAYHDPPPFFSISKRYRLRRSSTRTRFRGRPSEPMTSQTLSSPVSGSKVTFSPQ